MEFNIDPKDLNLQDAAGMQLVEVIRNLADESGTADYEDLENLPKINGVTLVGDKSSEDLNLVVSEEQITEEVDGWLEDNIAQETGYVLDSSLTMSNAAAPADKVGDLKSILDTKIGFSREEDSVLYNATSGEIPDTTFAETRRWFLNRIFYANEKVNSISFMSNRLTEQTVYFEIWEKSGNSLSKVKTVQQTVNEKKVYSIDVNYTGDSDYMVAINQSSHAVCYKADTGVFVLASSTTSVDATSLTYDSLSSAFENYYPCISIFITTSGQDNVVLVGDGQTYSEIQDALNAIVDDSVDNPYTIIVLPKKTPYRSFSMIRSNWSASYPWSNIEPRYVSLIGVDKANCVIRSDSGNYKLPCGEPMTNGIIKNLKFVMTNDAQDPEATQGGFCLHIDCRTKDDVGYNMTIEDCEFENASGPCLGIGMHKNCTLTIRRCNAHTTLSANYAPHEGYTNLSNYGVFFCHTSTLADSTNQKVSIEDCAGLCEEGTRALWISTAGDYDPSTASFYYRLLRNVFWNTTQDAPSYSISETLTADPMNFGNNIPTE